MLKLEIFKLKIGSRHLFHFSTLIFIISNNVMFISDIVYISFALIICIINQIYLLNRRFVYIRKFDLHAPQWGGGTFLIINTDLRFPQSGTDFILCACVCIIFWSWHLHVYKLKYWKEFPCVTMVFPLYTCMDFKHWRFWKRKTFKLYHIVLTSKKWSKIQKSVPVTYQLFSGQIHIEKEKRRYAFCVSIIHQLLV